MGKYKLELSKEYIDKIEKNDELSKEKSKDLTERTITGVPVGPWAYYHTTSTAYNCYGYATQFLDFVNPCYYSHGDSLYGLNKYGVNYFTSDVIKSFVISDSATKGVSARVVSGSNANLRSNEFLICLRAGYHDIDNDGKITINKNLVEADYHFMVRNVDGKWSHKPGGTPSENLGYINPSTYNWRMKQPDGSIYANFYNSNTIYIAISN